MTLTLTVKPTDTAPALLLRPWQPGDLTALVAAHADPEIRRFLTRVVEDEEDGRAFLAAQEAGWLDGTRQSFAVFETIGAAEIAETAKTTETAAPAGEPGLVGMVAVKRPDASAPVAEIGYWTVAAARGRGIAPRSVGAVAEWAFAEAGVHVLDLFHDVENAASCRVAQKAGFVLDGTVPPEPPAFPRPAHRHRRER